MQPGGYTNVTIGARFGMAALNPADVLGGNAAPLGDRNTDKYLVILTDGDNTENRFGRVGRATRLPRWTPRPARCATTSRRSRGAPTARLP